jgi:hypothetical protein
MANLGHSGDRVRQARNHSLQMLPWRFRNILVDYPLRLLQLPIYLDSRYRANLCQYRVFPCCARSVIRSFVFAGLRRGGGGVVRLKKARPWTAQDLAKEFTI